VQAPESFVLKRGRARTCGWRRRAQKEATEALHVPAGQTFLLEGSNTVHLVEEYARHLGQMDLLPEAVDGRTGC
jgi:Protein of unknown function (DUF664)